MIPRKLKATEYTAMVHGEWLDESTGEVMQKITVMEPEDQTPGPFRGRPPKGATRTRITRGRKKKVAHGYLMVDTESLGMLDLSRQEYRVFSFLLSKVEPGTGEIRVTNMYIAKSIGMTQANVSKTMKSLRERNIILAHDYGVWRVSAWIAWVGEWKKWYKASTEEPEPRWSLEEEPNLVAVP